MNNLRQIYKEFKQNNKLILKTQQRFRSEKHVFTEEIRKLLSIQMMIKKYKQLIH